MGDLGERPGGHPAPAWCALCLLMAATGAWCQKPATGNGGSGAFEWGERWHYYVHRTYSWQRMSMLAADSALDHLTSNDCKWGREPRYFAYRYAAGFGGRVVRNSIELGLGAAFNEDGRFRPSEAQGLGRRLRWAAVGSLTGYRGQTRVIAYSRLLATLGGAAAISLWDPRPFTGGRFFERAGSDYLGHLQNSLLLEFGDDLKAFGRRMRNHLRR